MVLTNSFIDALPKVAMSLSDKMGINVAIGGDFACTDGNTIRLPTLRANERAYSLARGYIDHEAAHIKHTTFNTAQGLNGLRHCMWNIFEDLRIEHKIGEEFPGCKINLRKLCKMLCEEDRAFAPTPNDPSTAIQSLIICKGRKEYLGQTEAGQFIDEARLESAKIFDQDIIHLIESITDMVPGMKDSYDALDLADQVIALIKKQHDRNNKKDETGSKNSSEKEQSSEEGNSSPGNKDLKQEEIKKILNNEVLDMDLGSMLEKRLNTETTREEEETLGLYPDSQSPEEIKKRGNFDEKDSVKASAGIKRRIAGMVQSKKFVRNHEKKTGRRVNYRVMHRLATYNPRIFKGNDLKTHNNTAVCILIDRSGSMRMQHRIEIANKAAYAVATALYMIPDVSVTVGAFPGKSSFSVVDMLPFEKHPKACKNNFSIGANGGTPLDCALYWSENRLLQSKRNRKIVLIITDGSPNDIWSCKKQLEKMAKKNFDIMGIGINMEITHLVENSKSIKSVNDLEKSMFDLLEKALK